jgi:hypothetical protein
MLNIFHKEVKGMRIELLMECCWKNINRDIIGIYVRVMWANPTP